MIKKAWARTAFAAAATVVVGSTLAGCSGAAENGGGEAGGTLILGVSTPATGPAAPGAIVADAIQCYFENRNENGGIEGYTVDVRPVDNQSTVTGGANAARQLLGADPFAVTVLTAPGFAGAQSVLAATPDVPVLVLSNGASVKKAAAPNFFGIAPDYETEAAASVSLMVAQGHEKIALVYDTTIAPGAPERSESAAEDAGAELTTVIESPAGTTNFVPVIEQLRTSGADAAVLILTMANVAGIMQAADQGQLDMPMITYENSLDPQLISLGGQSVEGLYVTGMMPLLDEESPAVEEFATVMGDCKPESIASLSLFGWNAGAIIEEGIRAAVQDGGEATRESFMEALRGLGGKQIGLVKSLGWSTDSTYSLDAGDTAIFNYYVVKDGAFQRVER
ncbi:ABC transporter substrate-binding protein [Microbacterium sp. No. 7]|uniref:ABC transporter substrate-binding protein n=1 Tax=Microbacterium sp. No. 7 TaxID=1714373 RepID=UPI0006CFDE71|nr:ABC transporter substrate-binding protein [Microbacterium sp. No. 7]ALJ22302.1 hypothetical protein AOA12_21410 [Microbacterium sp. No. 7]